ncbi:MAG TPA: hypothetical protein VN958_20580 [Chitinophagaceae bacterium]|nr:hypothetical protein [Chitinophagaceae bacterium]
MTRQAEQKHHNNNTDHYIKGFIATSITFNNYNTKMKKIFTLLLFINSTYVLHAQITICSWNLENFGRSKNDSTINFIANTVNDYDVIAIQEVVAGNGGAQAVARLSDALNRRGFK